MREKFSSDMQNKKEINSGTQSDIARTLWSIWQTEESEMREKMESDIKSFQKLAQYYYDNEGSIDYSEDRYTGKETQVDDACLYTLMRYKGKEILVEVGKGNYNTEVFTTEKIHELRWFAYGPLPLFVVTSWADQEHKNNQPRRFLNDHTMMYSPKGRQVQKRTEYKERQKPINYGDGEIMEYEKAITALQYASIRKIFFDRKAKNHIKTEFIDGIKNLQDKNFEEFVKWYTMKSDFYKDDEKSIELRDFLWKITDENLENMYDFIQKFSK